MSYRKSAGMLLALSWCCMSQATVNVSSDNNAGGGTLRSAVSDINSTSGTSPISLDVGINPNITTNMLPATESFSLVVSDVGTTHTIFGGGSNVVLEAQGTDVLLEISADITFSGAELVIDEGTVQFLGANNLSGLINVELSGTAPVLQFSSGATGTLAANVQVLGTTNILKVDPALTVTVTGAISGTVLEKQGTGELYLPLPNVYGGGTVIAAGTVHVGDSTSLGAETVTMNSGAILSIDAGLTISNGIVTSGLPGTIDVPSGTATVSGVISGSGSLITSGNLILTAANTYTSSTTVSSGTLSLVGTGTIATSSAVEISAGAILDVSQISASSQTLHNLSGSGDIVLGSKNLTVTQSLGSIFSGSIGESGSQGSLTLGSTSTATLILTGINLYEGATVINAGTLALSGAGSIAASASVTIDGTLDISGVIASAQVQNMSGTGDINLGNKTLVIVQNLNGTLSGIISGVAGNLTLDATSSAILVLEGVNTYQGTTDIAGGALALSGSGSIADSSAVIVDSFFSIADVTSVASIQNLSGSGDISIGQKGLVITQTSPGTFSGQILGSTGGVSLSGSSTDVLTLSGTSTYRGETSILGGTLALSGSGSIANSSAVEVEGSLDISATSAGAVMQNLYGLSNLATVVLGSQDLTVVQSMVTVYAGTINGAGNLQIDASSDKILFLSGVNTYTGDTNIYGGGIGLLDSGSIQQSANVLVDGVFDIQQASGSCTINNLSGSGYIILGIRDLVVVQNVSGEFSGMVLGLTGGLIKQGTGTLILSGTNVFEGQIQIQAGTLVGDADALPADIDNQSILVFAQDSDGTYAKSITGSGTVFKQGAGSLVFSADSFYTGATTVQEGTLIVNGSVALSSFTVDSGAVLRGSGTIGDVTNSGMLFPGNSSGVLHVSGNAVFANNSLYGISADGNGLSDLIATGTAAIGSGVDLQVEILSGFIPFVNTPYPIMEATSVTGTFGSITIDSPLVLADLSYSPQAVYMTLRLVPFASLGFEGNSQSVAVAIDSVIASGNPALDGIAETLLPLSSSQIDQALNQMQPALYKGGSRTQAYNAQMVQYTLSTRIWNDLNFAHCAVCDDSGSERKQPFYLWMDPFGDSIQQKSTTYGYSPQLGYQNNTQGMVLGFDAKVSKFGSVGALGAYTFSQVHWHEDSGKEKISSGYGGVYGSFLSPLFYVTTSAIGSWSHYDAYRKISYAEVSKTARNKHGGQQLLAHLDLGVNFGINNFTIRPFEMLDYTVQRENGYRETGAAAYDLEVDGSTLALLRNELGLQFSQCFALPGSRWMLSPKLSWIRESRLCGREYTAQFVHTGVPFSVVGYVPDRNMLALGFDFSGRMCGDLFTFDLYYNSQYGSGYTEYNYGGQIRFGF